MWLRATIDVTSQYILQSYLITNLKWPRMTNVVDMSQIREFLGRSIVLANNRMFKSIVDRDEWED
jgi:hypothetical protein